MCNKKILRAIPKMPRLSKRQKQIKELANIKRQKSSREPFKEILISEFDNILEESSESDEELIWDDNELDEKANDFVKILSDGMKNYVPPARKSIYI